MTDKQEVICPGLLIYVTTANELYGLNMKPTAATHQIMCKIYRQIIVHSIANV